MSKNGVNTKALEDLKSFEAFYLSHTNEETTCAFGFKNITALRRFCLKNNIAKKISQKTAHSFEYYLSNVDRVSFEKEYHESDDIFAFAKKHDLTVPMLYRLLDALKIRRRQNPLSYYSDRITKDALHKAYIEEGMSCTETAKAFNISNGIVIKLLRYYGIRKDTLSVEEMAALITKTELEKYYFSHTLGETEDYFNEKYTLPHKHSIMSLIAYYDIDKLNRSKSAIKSLLDCAKDNLTLKQISEKIGLGYCNVTHLVKQLDVSDKITLNPQTSSYEDEIADFLTSIGVAYERKNRSALNGLEIDLYLPERRIGIEFNGDFWHSSFYKEKTYHLNKSKLAKEKGIRLIHIWEHEWTVPIMKDKLKTLLTIATGNVKTKIYARDCELRQIDNKTAKALNEENHLQGHRNAQVTYGLFYEDELVQLMSFSKTKYNRNLKSDDSWEIIRGCPGSNNIVVGGVSKLLRHFIADQRPKEIFSYCDFNKFNGVSYEKAGMEFIGYTGPDLKYLLPNGVVVNRNPKKYKELKDKQIYKLYGAGSLKYKLTAR